MSVTVTAGPVPHSPLPPFGEKWPLSCLYLGCACLVSGVYSRGQQTPGPRLKVAFTFSEDIEHSARALCGQH
jgi:hypothetical protein